MLANIHAYMLANIHAYMLTCHKQKQLSKAWQRNAELSSMVVEKMDGDAWSPALMDYLQVYEVSECLCVWVGACIGIISQIFVRMHSI